MAKTNGYKALVVTNNKILLGEGKTGAGLLPVITINPSKHQMCVDCRNLLESQHMCEWSIVTYVAYGRWSISGS